MSKRADKVREFLDSECEYSEDGHLMGFVDAWPDREYSTGRNIWRHKYFCQFCLKVVVADTTKGRPG